MATELSKHLAEFSFHLRFLRFYFHLDPFALHFADSQIHTEITEYDITAHCRVMCSLLILIAQHFSQLQQRLHACQPLYVGVWVCACTNTVLGAFALLQLSARCLIDWFRSLLHFPCSDWQGKWHRTRKYLNALPVPAAAVQSPTTLLSRFHATALLPFTTPI